MQACGPAALYWGLRPQPPIKQAPYSRRTRPRSNASKKPETFSLCCRKMPLSAFQGAWNVSRMLFTDAANNSLPMTSEARPTSARYAAPFSAKSPVRA